jgi:DNA-binding response OmpR family regulator
MFMAPASSAQHILIIEDDKDIQEALQLLLTGRGYSVSMAAKPDEMEACLAKQRPDLLLLDIWVGGNDGREVARRLKLDPETKDIPIILLSANLSTPQIAKEIKADDFVLKPFDVDHLVGVVERRLRKKGMRTTRQPANDS